MDEIQVVTVSDGSGMCAQCGNGLWPGQAPCEHKLRARQLELPSGNDPEWDEEMDEIERADGR